MLQRFLFALVFLSLFPNIAMAENLFDIAPGDKSLVVLKSIFGGLGTFGTGSDPFGEGIKIFNGCVLVIGGILVAYTIVAGTIGTAHEGEMLGKKFSSVWVPIRTAMGTALVLPVIGGTYCTMQFIVGWLIVQGVGLADQVWTGYTTGSNMQFLSSKGMSSSNGKALGYNLFKNLACMEAITQTIKDIKDAGAGIVIIDQVGVMTTSPYNANKINFGASPEGNGLNSMSCGSVTLPEKFVKPTTGLGGVVVDDKAYKAAEELIKINQDATKELIKDLNVLAKDMVTSKKVINASQIDEAVTKYEDTVNKAAAIQVAKADDFKTLAKNASDDGWYLAGAYYTKMAWFADTVHRAAGNMASVSVPQSSAFNSGTLKDAVKTYTDLIDQTTKTNNGALPGGFGLNAETGTEENEDAASVFSKIFTWKPFDIDEGEHPLMGLKRMGNWLLGIYGVAISVIIAASGAAGGVTTIIADQVATAGTFSFLGALKMAINIINPFLIGILTVGLILSYVLPMLPFFLWFGATLGWLVMCIEAVLAAPMWAVMHLSANGDDMVGTGGQGYKLVLSLVLRPVLMIFGLIASFVLIQVIGQMLTSIFSAAFAVSQSDSNIILKVIGNLIVAPAIYAWSMFVLIKKSFTMIHVIPDEMLKWFGGGGSNHLGDFANTVGGEGGGAMAGAALMATQVRGAIGGAVEKPLAGLKNNIAEDKKAMNQINGQFGRDSNVAKELQGKSTQQKQAFMKNFNDAKDSLGGAGSVGGEAFDSEFAKLSNDPQNSDMTSSQLIDKAKENAIDDQYGKGAGFVVKQLSGGSLSGPKFTQAMNTLNSKMAKLTKHQTTDQATARIGTMLNDARNNFNASQKTDNPLSMADAVAIESDKLNREFALGAPNANLADTIKSEDEGNDKAPKDVTPEGDEEK